MTALVPFQRDRIREAAHTALWRQPDGTDREFDPRLVEALVDEAEVVAELFCPAAGYLTTDDQLDAIVERAVSSILRSVRSNIEHTFADELLHVPPPEFVAPAAGSWIAERHRDRIGTWHRVSGRLAGPSPWRRAGEWPAVVTSCGRRIDARFNDDGSTMFDWIVVADEPLVACGRCRRYPLREVVPG